MPYFIHHPAYSAPYVLDDEDAHFTHYFALWGWRFERRAVNDPDVLHAVHQEYKSCRPSLYAVWEDEYLRRVNAERARNEASSKAVRDAEFEKEIEMAKSGLKSKLSKLLHSRKGSKEGKEMLGYKDGLYVNHLEGMQKEWFEKENRVGNQRNGEASSDRIRYSTSSASYRTGST